MRHPAVALIVGLWLVWFLGQGCGDSKAVADSPTLTCVTVTFDGIEGRRCENEEAVCYLLAQEPRSVSCLKK